MIALDPATGQRLGRILCGSSVRALCWNSTDNRVYAANYLSSSVTVIDAGTLRPIRTVRVPAGPVALLHNPENDLVYCASAGLQPNLADTVTVLDGATNQVVARVRVGQAPAALALNRLRNKLYVANSAGASVSVIDAAS